MPNVRLYSRVRRDERAAEQTLLLDAQHHHDVGALERRLEPIEDLHAEPIEADRQQRARPDDAHLAAEERSKSAFERATRECATSPQIVTTSPSSVPCRRRIVNASSSACVGCSCSAVAGVHDRVTRRAARRTRRRPTRRGGSRRRPGASPRASCTVSRASRPSSTLDAATFMFTTSAQRRLPASSNDGARARRRLVEEVDDGLAAQRRHLAHRLPRDLEEVLGGVEDVLDVFAREPLDAEQVTVREARIHQPGSGAGGGRPERAASARPSACAAASRTSKGNAGSLRSPRSRRRSVSWPCTVTLMPMPSRNVSGTTHCGKRHRHLAAFFRSRSATRTALRGSGSSPA